MTDCPDPELVADPDTASRQELQVEKVNVTNYAACNRDKFHGLRDFYRGMK